MRNDWIVWEFTASLSRARFGHRRHWRAVEVTQTWAEGCRIASGRPRPHVCVVLRRGTHPGEALSALDE